jgi:NTP pyrophosphatase (non-canonical NTP hydrolase)
MLSKNIANEISTERDRQDNLWGEQNHFLPLFYTILLEEVGEVARGILKYTFDPIENRNNHMTETRKELIEVAAVAIAMIENIDRNYKYE